MATAALVDDDSLAVEDDHLTSKCRVQMLLREHILRPAALIRRVFSSAT